MSDHRRGRGQLRTADELARDLAIPVYYILRGWAQAAFPYSATPAPSQFVQVILMKPLSNPQFIVAFPVTVNWKQWEEVVVPVLEDPTWETWMSSGLYRGIAENLIDLIREGIRETGILEGYGSPDQETLGQRIC